VARFDEIDWYQTPFYYDVVFDADTGREADFLEAVLAAHGPPGGSRRVLEPACGTGRLLCELARRGYRVAGFDQSVAMLEFARRKLGAAGLGAALKRDRMESFRVRGRFDLAFCLLSTFKYLLAERDARAHLARVRDVLRPGGLYVLGVHLADYATRKPSHERWTGRRAGVSVVCNTRTWPPDRRRRRETIRNRLTVERDGAVTRQESAWECRTYSAAELQRTVRSVPGLAAAAAYDFRHDTRYPADPGDPGSWGSDVVLVLRRDP
jgi:SAM-dependent methyltransferase